MKAYTVKSFYVCRITGQVLSEVSFSFEDEPQTYLRPFSSYEAAKNYIEKEKRDWLLNCLEKFVNHKKKIIESAKHVEQEKALNVCVQALLEYEKKTLKHICEFFVKGMNYFSAIIPGENNNSHRSSWENFNELKAFCETELKQNL